MNAEQYLNEALGGNMNISTLKPLAWHKIMEGYARQKLAEALKPSHNSAMVQLQKMKFVVDEYGECVIKKGDKYYNDCTNLLQQHQ